MKKIRSLSESSFLKLFFAFFSLAFLIAAVCMPDRAQMFTGLWKILSQPSKISANYFAMGGYAATFLNMGLVGFICLGLFLVLGGTANNVSSLAYLLTVDIHVRDLVCRTDVQQQTPLSLRTGKGGAVEEILPFRNVPMDAAEQRLGREGNPDALRVFCGQYVTGGHNEVPPAVEIDKRFSLELGARIGVFPRLPLQPTACGRVQMLKFCGCHGHAFLQ